jgi:cytochrome c oxidase subunit II
VTLSWRLPASRETCYQELINMTGFILLADGMTSVQDLSIFNPASPPAESIRSLFVLVLAVTAAIFFVVEGVLLYSIVRFRRPAPDGHEPPQVYGSMPIEIAWTAAPMLIVFLLALILTPTEFEVRVDPHTPPLGSKPLYVTVIGHQWWWEYIYDKYEGQDLGIIAANELHIPAGDLDAARPVYLTLKISRCLPQLLGASPGGQDRPDSGPHESNVVSNEPTGPVPRSVCGVLWHATRPHVGASQRGFIVNVSELVG